MFSELSNFLSEPYFSIAILIAKTKYGNNHTGILTKNNDEIKFYHLAWHHKFICEDWVTVFDNELDYSIKRWVKFTSLTADHAVMEYRVPAIIRKIDQIHRKNKDKIPYGLSFRNTVFKDDGELKLGNNEHGLTCATFVVCFFRSIGIELIAIENWEAREGEDNLWKENILKLMRTTGVSETHVEKIKSEDFTHRIKPEEVAVATIEQILPASFEFCSVNGRIFNTIAV